jgi:hypothetical protein
MIGGFRMARIGGLPAFIIFVCAGLMSGAANADCGEAVTSGPAVEEIRALETLGAAGNVSGQSLANGERMFAPDYVATGPDGSVTTREAMLQKYTGGRLAPWASRFDIQDLNIRIYCDTAVVAGLSEALWKGAPQSAKPLHFRWLNVWTRTNGEWRLGASQSVKF